MYLGGPKTRGHNLMVYPETLGNKQEKLELLIDTKKYYVPNKSWWDKLCTQSIKTEV